MHYNHGIINYKETKAKCRHLKHLTCKGTLRLEYRDRRYSIIHRPNAELKQFMLSIITYSRKLANFSLFFYSQLSILLTLFLYIPEIFFWKIVFFSGRRDVLVGKRIRLCCLLLFHILVRSSRNIITVDHPLPLFLTRSKPWHTHHYGYS